MEDYWEKKKPQNERHGARLQLANPLDWPTLKIPIRFVSKICDNLQGSFFTPPLLTLRIWEDVDSLRSTMLSYHCSHHETHTFCFLRQPGVCKTALWLTKNKTVSSQQGKWELEGRTQTVLQKSMNGGTRQMSTDAPVPTHPTDQQFNHDPEDKEESKDPENNQKTENNQKVLKGALSSGFLDSKGVTNTQTFLGSWLGKFRIRLETDSHHRLLFYW